jgi:hypothetical protein
MATFSYDGPVIQYDTITVSGTYDIAASGGQGAPAVYAPAAAGTLCAGADRRSRGR